MQALQGYPIEAIAHGIRKFLRGECEDVNPKFCPHPPELAAIVRGLMPNRRGTPEGRYYSYKQPKSKIIERKVTKEYAFRLIDQGVHQRGCIWCLGDIQDRPDTGDLFAPDHEWQPAVPVGQKPPA